MHAGVAQRIASEWTLFWAKTKRAEASFVAHWERELGGYALAYITADLISEKMGELAAGDGRRKLADGEKPTKPPRPNSSLIP